MRISVVEMVVIHKHVNIHIHTKNVHIDHIIRYWVCTKRLALRISSRCHVKKHHPKKLYPTSSLM